MRVACVQFQASLSVEKNVALAFAFIDKAKQANVELIVFPEHFTYLGKEYYTHLKEQKNNLLQIFQKKAEDKKIAIHLGSICELVKNSRKVYNTSYFIDSNGEILNRYRKRNLFVANIKGELAVSEKKIFLQGRENQTTVFNWKKFKIGVGICFDLRFPSVFTEFQQKEVDLILMPAAFTFSTGKMHWEILLRARAIESLAYLIAPNQWGTALGNQIHYFGKSMIIDPWGEVLAKAPITGNRLLFAEFQTKRRNEVKSRMKLKK